MIDLIMNAMMHEIQEHGITLLQGAWKDDFLVHDKAFLTTNAKPGIKLAWVIGDNHSHMQVLGIHQNDNEMVDAYLRMSSSDHFYELTVREHDFKLKELSRDGFSNLKRTAIPYRFEGAPQSGVLFNGKDEIGRIVIMAEGSLQERVYVIRKQPARGICKKDQVALGLWAERCAIKVAGTLFMKVRYEQEEPYESRQVIAA